MSKFDYDRFFGGYDDFAVSKEKHSKSQAIEIYIKECLLKKGDIIAIGEGYVRHRAGVNEDKEPCVGWWLEYEEHKRSCPCFVFHIHRPGQAEYGRYEFIEI